MTRLLARTKNTPPLPPTMRGVFAYLDQVLSAEMLNRLAIEDLGIGSGSGNKRPHKLREDIARIIKTSFPLTDDSAPLSQDMEAFRLYHSSDISDALAAAYGLRARSLDPLPALTVDYAICSGGILSWADLDELLEAAAKDPVHAFRKLHRHMRKGDRVAHYSQPGSVGLILVRGDRLVAKAQTWHITPGFRRQDMVTKKIGGKNEEGRRPVIYDRQSVHRNFSAENPISFSMARIKYRGTDKPKTIDRFFNDYDFVICSFRK